MYSNKCRQWTCALDEDTTVRSCRDSCTQSALHVRRNCPARTTSVTSKSQRCKNLHLYIRTMSLVCFCASDDGELISPILHFSFMIWGCSSVVERSIRIRDARGSIPLISISFFDPCWRRLVAEAQKKGLTAVGFEPTPRKTGA